MASNPIDTYDHAVIDGGDGNDHIHTYDHSVVVGGAGNDRTEACGDVILDGGAGNDKLSAYDNANLSGGAGDDVIKIDRGNTTVNLGKGDGHDAVKAHDDVTVAITGYTRDDVVVTRGYGSTMVTFKGSDDSLLLDIDSRAAATLTFADGSSLSVGA